MNLVFSFFKERTLREQPEYEEIQKIIRETEERALIIEKTDVEQANRIREKIRRLRVKFNSNKKKFFFLMNYFYRSVWII